MSYANNIYAELFDKLKAHQYVVGNTNYRERIKKLNALKKAIEYTYKDKIREALYADFKKPTIETDLTEIYQVLGEIKYAKRHLKSWLEKQRVDTPLALFGASSWYIHEPKGVCLIISPWNFPINLTFGPLVSAIAAGNTVILKPSEMTPHASAVMAEIVADVFDENEVALVEGEVEVSQQLLQLPFNHIFFTGSPFVGKIVMKSAAEHLTSVTLELGGKSPTIIDSSASIKDAARRIAWGKFMNSGQICVTPDYVLIRDSEKEAFITEFKKQLDNLYTQDASKSESYGRIVNEKHFSRLVNYIEEAKSEKAIIDIGGQYDNSDHYISPTVISNLNKDNSLLHEEIFGPILPLISYSNIEEAIDYINSKEKPLALYIYSKNKKATNHIIANTRAGGTCINNNVLHYSNHHLPFGGSNNSGIGKGHGYFGFQEFSNSRGVLKQHVKGINEWLYPPFTKIKQKLTDLTIKWF